MRLIGITGGVGAGKSELLHYIRQHYLCEIYLADEVAHEVKRPGQECYERLVELMGRGILDADGQINRSAMASRIFLDRGLLQKVNGIVHPAVRKYLLERIEEAQKAGKAELFFIEAALLIETGYKEIVDEMWYIYADEETRKKRLIRERGYTEERVARIMAQQLSEEVFRQKSDFILDNSGPLAESFSKIDERLRDFTRL